MPEVGSLTSSAWGRSDSKARVEAAPPRQPPAAGRASEALAIRGSRTMALVERRVRCERPAIGGSRSNDRNGELLRTVGVTALFDESAVEARRALQAADVVGRRAGMGPSGCCA